MITKRRMFYASLASATAFFVVPAICSYYIMQTPNLLADGTPDNAPIRGVGVFLIISPFLFVVVTTLAFVSGVLLQHLKLLRPSVVVGGVTVLSLGLSLLMVQDRPFGWRDALYYFGGFTGLLLSTLGLSAVVWWKVAMRPNNTVERDGPEAARPSP